MNISKFIKNEDGFTVQEILVVLIVGSILISLSLALFQFTNELFQTWYGTNELKSDAQRILCTMAMDIQQARTIKERTPETLILSRGIGRDVKYYFDGTSLMRNEVVLTPHNAKAIMVRISEIKSDNVNVAQYRLKLFAQSKWISYESEMVAMMVPSSKAEFITFQ